MFPTPSMPLAVVDADMEKQDGACTICGNGNTRQHGWTLASCSGTQCALGGSSLPVWVSAGKSGRWAGGPGCHPFLSSPACPRCLAPRIQEESAQSQSPDSGDLPKSVPYVLEAASPPQGGLCRDNEACRDQGACCGQGSERPTSSRSVPFRSVPGASRPAGEAAEPLCLPPAPSGAGQHRQGRAAAGRAPMGGGGPGRAARPCPRPYNCRERGVPYTASRAEPGRRCWCADLLPAGAPDRCVPARAEPGSPGRPRGGVQGRRGARRAELCPPAVGGRTAARLPRRVQRGVFLAGRRWGVLRDPRSELARTGVGSGAVPGSLALSRVSPCRGLEPWLST